MALPSDIAAVSSENCDPARQKGNKNSVSIQADKGTHRCTCRSKEELVQKKSRVNEQEAHQN